MWYVYIAQNSAQKLYIGVTQDPKQRLKYHNQKRGAAFTKHIPTYEIVFLEKYQNLAEARRREIQLKKWRREKKDFLISRYAKGLSTKLGTMDARAFE